ncbi:MAG: alpha/beta hydrolase [Methanobacterium sp. ERen5]|nr:MAG: alpha/beta hydrolase [Methanobacterium sp. ERen5]
MGYEKEFVNSTDGTVIGYRKMGNGPGLVLLHGGTNSSQHFMELGDCLSKDFTVYIPDRRGRGLSGDFGDHYDMEREMEDLNAVLRKTGAKNIFGLSSGALIALEAALNLPMTKAAIYEPPLDIDNNVLSIMSFMKRFDREISEGKIAAGTATITKDFGSHFGLPKTITKLPHFLLELLFKLYLKTEQVKEDEVPFKVLIPTFHYDYELVKEEIGQIEKFRNLKTEVLLIGGTESPAFLKKTMKKLKKTIPNVKQVELKGLSHTGPLVTGNPESVAEKLKDFFSS